MFLAHAYVVIIIYFLSYMLFKFDLVPLYLLSDFSALYAIHSLVRVRLANVDGESFNLCLRLFQCWKRGGIPEESSECVLVQRHGK